MIAFNLVFYVSKRFVQEITANLRWENETGLRDIEREAYVRGYWRKSVTRDLNSLDETYNEVTSTHVETVVYLNRKHS